MKTTKVVGKAIEVKGAQYETDIKQDLKEYTELLNMVNAMRNSVITVDSKVLTYAKNLLNEKEARILTILKGK